MVRLLIYFTAVKQHVNPLKEKLVLKEKITMLPFIHLEKTNTKDNLWIYILLLLMEKDIYAWEIPAMIEKKYGFKPGKITPYRVLYRLEADGFTESKTEQKRRVYKITEKGKQELQKAKNFYQNVLKEINSI